MPTSPPPTASALRRCTGRSSPHAAPPGRERRSSEVLAPARRILSEAGIEPEYLEIRDAEWLQPIETFNGRPALIAVAARIGEARLIDNLIIEPQPVGEEGQET